MFDIFDTIGQAPHNLDREVAAFPRYADKINEPELEYMYQAPRGEPLRRINAAEMYRVSKTPDHWDNVARSKSFLADKFLPPIQLPLDESIRSLFNNQLSDELLSEKLVDLIPNLNHDQIVNLSLHLAFETQLNSKDVWRAIEDAATASLHLLDTTQMCQLEWATTQLKPKQTTARFNTLLMSGVLERVDEATPSQLNHIMQGFRNKQNKGLY